MDSNGKNANQNKVTDNTTMTPTQIERMIKRHLRKVDTVDRNENVNETINAKMKEFSTNIIVSLTEIVDTKLNELENKFGKMVAMPEEMYKSFSEAIKTNLPRKPKENLKTVVKQAMTERKNAEEYLEERKANIIVFNMQESKANTAEQRKSDDTALFIETCNTVCDDSITSSEVIQSRRLGPRLEDKPRPLLIKVKTEEIKKKIFFNLYKLKDSSISMSHDMTIEERKKRKTLVDEANQKTKVLAESTDENAKNWVYRVRGPPWKQKIEKVKRLAQA